MQSVNKVILVGRLGKDPEIRSTATGKDVANFSVATSETWTDKASGEKKEKTEWHNISVWLANTVNFIAAHVKKGAQVYVEGSLTTRKWTDKDGVVKYKTEITLSKQGDELHLLNKPSDTNAGDELAKTSSGNTRTTKYKVKAELDDEIPF